MATAMLIVMGCCPAGEIMQVAVLKTLWEPGNLLRLSGTTLSENSIVGFNAEDTKQQMYVIRGVQL